MRKPKRVAPQDLDLLITSIGGVATTLLINYFGGHFRVNSNEDNDRLKHLPYPPLSLKKDQKFIYVFGDPVHATISLFRRNFHWSHSRKIIEGLRLNEKPIPAEMTLEEYAAEGIDRFYFREHFKNWYSASNTYPILFIRYESLYKNLNSIFEFLDIPHELVATFPSYRDREAYSYELSETTLVNLQNMHHDFNNELIHVPDIRIQNPSPENLMNKARHFCHYSSCLLFWNLYKMILPIYLMLRNYNGTGINHQSKIL